MATDPTTPEPAGKPTSRLWKWIRRVGCVLFLGVSGCCLLTCTMGWLGERWLHNLHADELDRIHAQALRGGDLKALHERADPEFKKRHTFEVLQEFCDARPGLLERDRLDGLSLSRHKFADAVYVRVRSRASLFSLEQFEIVGKVVDGTLVFVGISPGLDALVPPSIKFGSGSSGRRRHHH